VHTRTLGRLGRSWRTPASEHLRGAGVSACSLVGPRRVNRSWPHRRALEESTYLTVVCPLFPLPAFASTFAVSVATALHGLGIPAAVVDAEVAAIVEGTSFARNDNRSLLGSVNDVAFHADVQLEDARRGDRSALERVQNELNEMPHVHREPLFPSQAVRLLFRSAFAVH
jgi:hypothetical protein